jgi:5-methylcytosine-specific restriction enzyme subunit McrC
VIASVTVREFARLTTEHVAKPSLDRAQVSPSAFDWLCRLGSTFRASGAALVEVESARWLKLDNYVGVIETPCGTRLEILPKHVDEEGSEVESRSLLQRMICAAMDLPVRETSETDLKKFDAPLSEWVIGRFLAALDHLVKRGVRSDYQRVEAAERYLRGQLDTVRQMRQPPGRQHIFHIRHDVFVPDRPENRLLKLALDKVAQVAKTPANWRLAQELRSILHEVPASKNMEADFRAWRRDRLMAHYQPVRPWCELILYRQMPYSLVGDWRGISLLFPMEKLFERFVASALRRALLPGAEMVPQARSEYLCSHDGGDMFRLEPDMLITHAGRKWVLDTKWKRLDAAARSRNYELSQADFYQLHAYGTRYLGSQGGQMALIYPCRKTFPKALPVFNFGGGINLWVLPFDLDRGVLIDPERAGIPIVQTPLEQICMANQLAA